MKTVPDTSQVLNKWCLYANSGNYWYDYPLGGSLSLGTEDEIQGLRGSIRPESLAS